MNENAHTATHLIQKHGAGIKQEDIFAMPVDYTRKQGSNALCILSTRSTQNGRGR